MKSYAVCCICCAEPSQWAWDGTTTETRPHLACIYHLKHECKGQKHHRLECIDRIEKKRESPTLDDLHDPSFGSRFVDMLNQLAEARKAAGIEDSNDLSTLMFPLPIQSDLQVIGRTEHLIRFLNGGDASVLTDWAMSRSQSFP